MNKLTEFWNKLSLDNPHYVHPMDDLDEKRVHDPLLSSFQDYVDAFGKNEFNPTNYLTGLLPQPYLGNLQTADIFILMLNPGFHPIDLYAQEKHLSYREAIVSTLRQKCTSHMFLDPKWSWTAGFQWWEKKLRQTVKLIARDHFEANYALALDNVAKRIASIELVAYPSRSFAGKTDLSSCDVARQFVRTLPSSKTIIVSRRVKDWDIPERKNTISYNAGQSRNASFGPNSPGGKAILKFYKENFKD